jgi:hypothetical protein
MKLAVVTALAASLSAFADIKVNDNLSVNGYLVGSYQYTDIKNVGDTSSFNVDSALLGSTISFKPVTAVVSLYYVPAAKGGANANGDEATVLDAYVKYDAGSGVTVTGGKFLSYMGYESFYPIDMDQISYADGDFLAAIPGYHDGVKLDYADSAQGAGVAVVDSDYVLPKAISGFTGSATQGDGDLKDTVAVEPYYTYTGVTNLTLWAGLAYQTKGKTLTLVTPHYQSSVTTLDVWASYQITKELRAAAEYVHKDGGIDFGKGYDWIAFADYSFTDKLSAAARVSGEKVTDAKAYLGNPVSNDQSFTKYTISPTYVLTDHLKLRAEYSYYAYKNYYTSSTPLVKTSTANFVGVQAIFQF